MSTYSGGLHPLKFDVQPDHCTIGSRQASIDVANHIGAIAALRANENVSSTSPLHHAHPIEGRAVGGSIATQHIGATVGIASATARENHFLHHIYILDSEAGQIGSLLGVCSYVYVACT